MEILTKFCIPAQLRIHHPSSGSTCRWQQFQAVCSILAEVRSTAFMLSLACDLPSLKLEPLSSLVLAGINHKVHGLKCAKKSWFPRGSINDEETSRPKQSRIQRQQNNRQSIDKFWKNIGLLPLRSCDQSDDNSRHDKRSYTSHQKLNQGDHQLRCNNHTYIDLQNLIRTQWRLEDTYHQNSLSSVFSTWTATLDCREADGRSFHRPISYKLSQRLIR